MPHCSTQKLPPTPLGKLPPRMRLLSIVGHLQTGRWLAEALACDSASEVILEQAVGCSAGVARLRDEVYDAVVVTHQPEHLDALELVEALRASGSEEPIVVLGEAPQEEMAALCFEVEADDYLCLQTTTTRWLIWSLARAMERHHLIKENRRLGHAQRSRLQQERSEADRLLEQQRGLIEDLEAICHAQHGDSAGTNAGQESRARAPLPLPARLVDHYRELLRAHVIMGSGNLADDMSALAEVLVSAGISAQQTLELHLAALQDLLQGLGGRSTRHVLTRADLAVLEVVVHVAEGYRRRYNERQSACRPAAPPPPSTENALDHVA